MANSLSDEQIKSNTLNINKRRQQLLDIELKNPFPGLGPTEPADTFDLGHLNASLAGFEAIALQPSPAPADVRLANARVADVLAVLKQQPIYKGTTPPRRPGRPADDEWFHFEIAQYLFRIYKMYGSAGTAKPGILSDENAVHIIEIFFDWAKSNCLISDPQSLQTWTIWGSENHSGQRDSSCWAAASLLAVAPAFSTKVYDDGSTAIIQLPAWTQFLTKYLSERPRHGTLIEYFSPTYAQYTLTNFYLYADFSDDPKLKRLATASLDLWWATWAQEQIDGIHGGSKTRTYAKTVPAGSAMPTAAWLYFGLGAKPKALLPGESAAIASNYRPPAVVTDLALDAQGRGTYDVLTRAPGLAERPIGTDHLYHVDDRHNGVLRLAHVTPDYVMGLAMLPLLPTVRWTAISDQNRWAGLVLAGGDPLARIVPTITSPKGRKQYNALFGVQNGGMQLIRSMVPPGDKERAALRVWFGKPLRPIEDQGWIFVDSTAYVAVRPVTGGWSWDPEQPQWMIPRDPGTAIIVQAAGKGDYPDLAAFEAAVAKLKISATSDSVSVAGLGPAGTLSMGLGSSGLLQVDGRDVNLEPDFAFKSPFINAPAAPGEIIIQKGERALRLDFAD